MTNHISLKTINSVKVDILVDASKKEVFLDNTKNIFNYDIYFESLEDIIAKKINFRSNSNKTRDIINLGVSLTIYPHLLETLLYQKKISSTDLKTLQVNLKNLDINGYLFELELVEPEKKFFDLAKNSPKTILKKLERLI